MRGWKNVSQAGNEETIASRLFSDAPHGCEWRLKGGAILSAIPNLHY
jgi:hypothetical protein